MTKTFYGLALLSVMAAATSAAARADSSHPIADKIAAKVIAHYQSSSCQQLAAEKQKPPTAEAAATKQRAVQFLHQNPQDAQYFIGKVATPIANKMFECGMIP